MKHTSLAFLFFTASMITSSVSFAETAKQARCTPQKPEDQVLYNTDFKWGYSMPAMMKRFDEIYNGSKRLDRRAYFDNKKNKYILPFADDQGGPIELPESFIDSVTQHIEKAFARKFIDAVFFPDMGHSHILIPLKKYEKEYDPIAPAQFSTLYQKIFKDPKIKVVYHTAEQLTFLDNNNNPLPDRSIQWRYYTRNLVGDNAGEKKIEIYNALDESKHNTLGDVKSLGFRWWGSGFNLSAHKDGCFSYKRDGKEYFYDISMYDLPADPQVPVVEDGMNL